jgi:hypothetical protein
MTVLPLSLFMLRIVVFFLPLTVVAFQRKRSESLKGLLLRIDLRRDRISGVCCGGSCGSTACVIRTFGEEPMHVAWNYSMSQSLFKLMEDETFHFQICNLVPFGRCTSCRRSLFKIGCSKVSNAHETPKERLDEQ